MSDASEFLESFSVICPRCDCRFQPAVRATAYFAACPDCAEPVRVPAEAEVEDDWKREQAVQGDGETYRLAISTDWNAPDEPDFAADPAEPESPTPIRQDESPEHKIPQDESKASQHEQNEPSPPASPTVSCPACGANFEPGFSDQPQVVLCPECLEDVQVPAASPQPPPSPSASETDDEDVEEIEFLTMSEPAAKPPADDDIPWDTYLLEESEGEAAVPRKPKKKRRKKTPRESEPAKNPPRGGRPVKHVDDVMAEVRQVERDPPPEWTFLTGVADFLIRPAVAVRWALASLGFCLMGWLVAMTVHFYDAFPIALPFFVLPLIWIMIMTLSYTAASSLPILLETAAGNDEIEGWPEPVMKEQAVDLIYLCFLVIVTQVLSFVLGPIVSVLIGPTWLVSMLVAYLLFPIVLLSSLEADSPYVPFTLPILKSLKIVPGAWGVFYGLSFGLLLVWLLPLVWVFGRSGSWQFFGMLFLAPLAAGWCFLYARLLGRLAWRASLEFEEEEDDEEKDQRKRKKPKKKKKPSVSESSGELQSAP